MLMNLRPGLGTRLALSMGMMTGFHTPNAREPQRVQWQHLLFVKGSLTMSCDVDLRGDGTYSATLFPLWAPDDAVTQMFGSAQDAARWHSQMAQRLQLAGWLLLGVTAVTEAA